jgi:DNA-binding NarL/FixJ family response regulator
LVKIIAISGGGLHNAAHYLQTAKLLGAAKVLAKPFSTEILMAAVNDLLPGGAGAPANIQSPAPKAER